MSTIDEAKERARVFAEFGLFEGLRLTRAAPIRVTGPVTLRIELGETFDVSNQEHIVVTWDDATELEAHFGMKEGTKTAIDIPEQKGQFLEVWCTDPGITVRADVLPFGRADSVIVAEAQRAAGDKAREEAEPDFFDRVSDRMAKLLGLQIGAGVLALALVGVGFVVYTKVTKNS